MSIVWFLTSLYVSVATGSPAAASGIYQLHDDTGMMCFVVAIAPDRALLPWHCVQPANQAVRLNGLHVRSPTQGINLNVVHVDTPGQGYHHLGELSGRDYAVIGVIPASLHPVDVTSSQSPTGEPLYLFKPSEDGWEAHLLSVKSMTKKLIYAESLTCKGDSGLPVVNASGDLIAIASWRAGKACGSGTSVFNRVYAHQITRLIAKAPPQ